MRGIDGSADVVARHRGESSTEALRMASPTIDASGARSSTAGALPWWRGIQPRISMRVFVLIILVLGTALGIVGARLRKQSLRRLAVARLAKTGARFTYDKNGEAVG